MVGQAQAQAVYAQAACAGPVCAGPVLVSVYQVATELIVPPLVALQVASSVQALDLCACTAAEVHRLLSVPFALGNPQADARLCSVDALERWSLERAG